MTDQHPRYLAVYGAHLAHEVARRLASGRGEASATPPAFRDLLISIAESARGVAHG